MSTAQWEQGWHGSSSSTRRPEPLVLLPGLPGFALRHYEKDFVVVEDHDTVLEMAATSISSIC